MSALTRDEKLKLAQTLWPNQQLQLTTGDDWYLSSGGALRHFIYTTNWSVGIMVSYLMERRGIGGLTLWQGAAADFTDYEVVLHEVNMMDNYFEALAHLVIAIGDKK
jgi:hypothetical protein